MTTADYKELHTLNQRQHLALAALAGGSTHQVAAEAAGVHRVTVTAWANHHPAFIAELNRSRADAAAQALGQVKRLTSAALDAVEEAVRSGDVQAALKWLALAPLPSAADHYVGPTVSVDVVEGVRQSSASSDMAALL